ncbi:MAG: hypothetical protein M0P70_16100 [Desulfobulbaceae bacterium]|nr:hypothetical protein [Desulfobulbaceae bacterium]
MAVLFWGGQGAIFSICYMLFFDFLSTPKKLRNFSTLLKGGICGLFSSLPNIIFSWQGFAQSTSVEGIYVLPQVSRQLSLDLLYYAVGCFILGAVVAFFAENIKKNKK